MEDALREYARAGKIRVLCFHAYIRVISQRLNIAVQGGSAADAVAYTKDKIIPPVTAGCLMAGAVYVQYQQTLFRHRFHQFFADMVAAHHPHGFAVKRLIQFDNSLADTFQIFVPAGRRGVVMQRVTSIIVVGAKQP